MPAISLVLLLVIGGGLTLFALQNWSPSLSLVFLGMPTPPLPLAVWILLGLAAGVMTGLSIAALLRWYSYLEARNVRGHGERPRYFDVSGERYSHYSGDIEGGSAYPAGSWPPQKSKASETDFIRRSKTTYNAHQQRDGFDTIGDRTPKAAVPTKGERCAKNRTPSSAASNNDDWEQENKISEDWDDAVTSASTEHVPRQSRGNEGDKAKAGQEETQDSFYSYGSQDKGNSGKIEDVYEANYRVIIPPVREESDAGENDEDWGLDEDET
ncbi:MAG: hypothetical protein EBE86_020565 [Hormoscilla sp. GUM202]|nr:hypothetical protein [Hormoscilla sp. GUM202]